MKAQVISMDFIITFVLFMGILSVFFIQISSNIEAARIPPVPNEYFNLIEQKFNFLHRAVVDEERFTNFILTYNTNQDVTFFDPLQDKRYNYSYCIMIIQDQVIKNTVLGQRYAIHGENYDCGDRPSTPISELFYCNSSMTREATMMQKPVIFNGNLSTFAVLRCEI